MPITCQNISRMLFLVMNLPVNIRFLPEALPGDVHPAGPAADYSTPCQQEP